MDAFFASVEQHDDPALKGKPVIIGASARGVVSAASYEARRFGVRSAMPVFQARRLCPQGVFLPGRRERYGEVSRQIMAVLSHFSPLVEQASVDEAFLDASGLERVFGSVEQMAGLLKCAVQEQTGLTCSVGLAPVKFLAKIASDMHKPDGLTIITPEQMPEFVRKLPVNRIPGVGKKTMPALEALGVRSAGDVLRYPETFWLRSFGKMGGMLHQRAQGIDPRPVTPWEPPKSESAENTFAQDTSDRELLQTWLLRQAERVGANLRRQGLAGRTVTLKVKYADFTQLTRAQTLEQSTNLTEPIYRTACALLDTLNPRQAVRLIGVGVSHFGQETPVVKAKAVSLSLFDMEGSTAGRPSPAPEGSAGAAHADNKRHAALDAVIDTVRERFGPQAVTRGKLFGFCSRPVKKD